MESFSKSVPPPPSQREGEKQQGLRPCTPFRLRRFWGLRPLAPYTDDTARIAGSYSAPFVDFGEGFISGVPENLSVILVHPNHILRLPEIVGERDEKPCVVEIVLGMVASVAVEGGEIFLRHVLLRQKQHRSVTL